MFCVIYRSSRHDQTYLYIERQDDFLRVPQALLKNFGQPHLVMQLPLDGSKPLVNAHLNNVILMLREQGYYLQIPPPLENFLDKPMTIEV